MYRKNYAKKKSLWEYTKDDPNDNINSESFKFQPRITGRTSVASNTNQADTKDVKVAVSLKYFSNFWRTLEMPLIDCELNVMLT